MAELTPLRNFSIEKVRNHLKDSATDLADARVTAISLKRRFDAAYDAAFNCALALLEANKQEVKPAPGHHRVTFDFLISTLKLRGETAEFVPLVIRTRNATTPPEQ